MIIDQRNYLEHSGRSILNGAPIGSGRYPLGSGKRPYQHDNDTLSNGNAIRLHNYSGKAYFVTEKKLNNTTLHPRVPNNWLTKNGYEDNKTKRVSFAPTIDKCLAGLSQNLDDKVFYVYEPKDISKCKIYKPNEKAVPDSSITDELWIVNSVELKYFKKIKVTGNKGEDGIEYNYGDQKAILFNDWLYEDVN